MTTIDTLNDLLNNIQCDFERNRRVYAKLFDNYRLTSEVKNLCLNVVTTV
jgi:hypothetical protein